MAGCRDARALTRRWTSVVGGTGRGLSSVRPPGVAQAGQRWAGAAVGGQARAPQDQHARHGPGGSPGNPASSGREARKALGRTGGRGGGAGSISWREISWTIPETLWFVGLCGFASGATHNAGETHSASGSQVLTCVQTLTVGLGSQPREGHPYLPTAVPPPEKVRGVGGKLRGGPWMFGGNFAANLKHQTSHAKSTTKSGPPPKKEMPSPTGAHVPPCPANNKVV